MKKQDDLIAEVLKRADSKKRDDIEIEWFIYMKEKLKFPFQAEVNLISYSAAVRDGDIVKVLALDNMIDLYGVIMKVKKGRKTLYIPLEELELSDKKSKNHEIIYAFLDWYYNY